MIRAVVGTLLVLLPAAAPGQDSAIHRQPLESTDWPAGLATRLVATTIDAGGLVAAHRHPGLEVAYVAKGGVTVTIDDAPPRHVTVGSSFQVPPRTRHSVLADRAGAALVVSTYIIEAGKPIATPAP